MSDIAPRVRHLEGEVKAVREDQKLVFSKLDQISVAIAGLQAGRPALGVMDGVKTGLQLLQTMVLLIGAAVASIVYVSSNANNGQMAIYGERISVLQKQLERLERPAWSTQTRPGS